MIRKTSLALLVSLALIASCGQPQQSQLSQEEMEAGVTVFVEEVETPASVMEQAYIMKDQMESSKDDIIGALTAADVILDKIINMGKKIWTIVEKGKPVVNITYDYANALPEGVRGPQDLDNFSDLQFKSYRTYGKNLYGATVYDVTYTLVHQYNGDFLGKGKYLSTVAVIPSNVSVLWGYTVNYKTSKVVAMNVGSSESPVATAIMELKFKVSTILKSSEFTKLYQFRGDKATVIESI